MADEWDAVEVYTKAEIVPIPAICTNRSRPHAWVGRDAIRAPSLRGCRCFWCGKPLKPHPDYPPVEDAATKRARLRAAQPRQLSLTEVA